MVASLTLVFTVYLLLLNPAFAQFTQQGPKLLGNGAIGPAKQGWSVALSGDSNTAIVGGPTDNSNAGAAWVYTRSNGVWNQQGSKLVGAGAVGNVLQQGTSVALSADGNTAIVGGPGDNFGTGAAWIFTRSGGMWSPQVKLIGSDAVGSAAQGQSVALSADGNTAIIGGPLDNFFGPNGATGAAWIFTRSGGMWTQQGPKLVGTGAIGVNQGSVYGVNQGWSVALSADGNTAIMGGPFDNDGPIGPIGAAWVFARSNGVWSQQGPKLVGTGADIACCGVRQGWSVALSADGDTAIIGGPVDNGGTGAAWVFVRSNGVWNQQGMKLTVTGSTANAQPGTSVALSGDGNTAMLGGPGDNAGTGAAWVPHMLRHACGFALANAGHDTRALQAYRGHRTVDLLRRGSDVDLPVPCSGLRA
jgi:hypothetical protein